MKRFHRTVGLPLVCAGLLLTSGARAEPLDLPPPLPAAGSEPRAASVPPSVPAAADEVPMADLPPARKTSPETRIDQRRVGNRVVDITVTPAGSTRSYTVQNREGQRPLSVHELSSGLSVPTFFKLDF